MKAAKNNTQK